MKKILITVLSFACLLCLVFVFTACGDGNDLLHTHNYLWVDNGDGTHKQHCSASGCNEPDINSGNHDFSNGNCVCGKVKPVFATVGLEYTLNQDGTSYAVTGIGTAMDTEIVIPSEYAEKPVTAIANSAFEGCASLTGIIIPHGVTEIGIYAFAGCSLLRSVSIPDGVTTIGSRVFGGCNALINLTIPGSITFIGFEAFYGCSSLIKVSLDSVTNVADYAFYGCSSLASVTFGDKVSSIGGFAFSECGSLTSITLGNSVIRIGNNAFSECISLTSIMLGNGIISIGYGAFENCPIETASIPAIACADVNNFALKTVIITSGESIPDFAFEGCSGLTNLTIGNTVTAIGKKAFYNCSSVTIIQIPDGVTSIGNYSFYGCNSLTSITVSVNNTNYASQDGILYDKAKTQFIHIPKAITGTVTIPNGVTSIGSNVFSGCRSLSGVIIPNGVSYIGWGAFYNCAGLSNIELPAEVTSIDEDAFAGCTELAVIRFNGTIEEWNIIAKGYNWDFATGNYIVHCYDGNLAKHTDK